MDVSGIRCALFLGDLVQILATHCQLPGSRAVKIRYLSGLHIGKETKVKIRHFKDNSIKLKNSDTAMVLYGSKK